MSKSKLGVNLPPMADYHCGARYYIDLVKSSGTLGSFDKIDSGDPGPRDAEGYPTGDHAIKLTPFGKGLKGVLTVICKGRLESIAIRASGDRPRNFRYDANTNTTTCELPITNENVGLGLQIRGKGLGKLQILRAGYTNADAVFTKELIDVLKRFGFARFMDPFLTNDYANKIVKWAERPQITDRTYTEKGMPWEHAVDLANAAGIQPWLNVPYPADEECATKFAEMVRDRLKPEIMPIWELDNESWGTHFIQGQRHADAAMEEAKTDAALRATPWGGDGDWNTWRWNRLLKRAAWLNTILKRVYGSMDKYRLIVNTQWANPGIADVWATYLKASNQKLSDIVHAVAIAPYADLSEKLRDDPNLTPDQCFAPDAFSAGDTNDARTKKWQAWSAANGVRCWIYEGGINCVNKAWGLKIPAVRTIQSDPRMGQLVETYLDNWDWAGGGGKFNDDRLFGYFNLQSPWLIEGPAANFGCTEDVGDLGGPKMKALLSAAERYVSVATNEPEAEPIGKRISRVVVVFNDGTQQTIG